MKVKLLSHRDKPISASGKARQFLRPVERKPVWIPVSVIKHISQQPCPDRWGYHIVIAEIEDWFAEKEGL